jgi:CubicO group peptidase (beta-lactamase class C family)
MRKLGLAVVVAALAASTAGAESPLEGRWDVVIERPGWEPREAKGVLVLERKGKAWDGSLTFEVLMNGNRQALEDLEVRGSKVEFRLGALEYRLEGKLEKGRLVGSCKTPKGAFAWTGTRGKVEAVELFEKGLSFVGDFEKGDAAALGLDVEALSALVRAAQASDTDALIVLKDGKVVCERTFGREGGAIPTMSVTKFVTAFAAGLLLEEKKIASLDAPVSTWFPEWKEGGKEKVTLRHLLTHTSGIAHAATAAELNAQRDRVAYVRKATVDAPGTAWSYNNDAVALLSGVLAAAAGEPVDAYLERRLFVPLGVGKPRWNRDGAGNTVTYAELWLSARDLARVGRLVAEKGSARGKALVAPETIELLGSEATPLQKTQGLLWFRILDEKGAALGWRHDGWLGQHLVVYPRDGLVGVRLRRGAKGDAPQYGFGGFPGLLLNCRK